MLYSDDGGHTIPWTLEDCKATHEEQRSHGERHHELSRLERDCGKGLGSGGLEDEEGRTEW
jgi:hypothetical protein